MEEAEVVTASDGKQYPKKLVVQSSDGKIHPPHTILDKFGRPIGWPHRSGQLEIINGEMITVKTQLVEIVIPSQATPVNSYPFPDQPNLRNASLWGIEVFCAGQVPKSPATQNNLLSDAQLGYVFLNLQDYASFNFLQNKPVRTLQSITRNTSVPGRSAIEGFIGQHVNWPNGSIFWSDPTQIAANTAYSFLMEVRYSYNDNWQKDGLGKNFGSKS